MPAPWKRVGVVLDIPGGVSMAAPINCLGVSEGSSTSAPAINEIKVGAFVAPSASVLPLLNQIQKGKDHFPEKGGFRFVVLLPMFDSSSSEVGCNRMGGDVSRER